MGAGVAIEAILSAVPGPRGYAWLHLCTFGFLVLSYLVFSMQHEVDDLRRAGNHRRSLRGNLASIPSLLRDTPVLRRFLLVIFCGLAVWVVMPFMALYAQQRLGVDAAFVGRLVSAQMVGVLLGNGLAAWVGDRWGGRTLLLIAYLLHLLVFGGANLAASEVAFMAVFAGWGLSFGLHQVGGFTLAMDVMPIDRRPTGMALMSSSNAVALVVMSTLGGQLQQWWPSNEVVLWPACVVVAGFLLLGLATLLRIDGRSGV